MLGGYQIINLTKLDLTIGTSQVSITDADVLAQLRELREHIEDNYNFAIPLNRKLKPVLLRLRDKKNGEKQEVSVWANLSIITNNRTFKIEALVDSVSMKVIQIEVVFQQLTDDDGNKYWDIKTAKYLYTENINIEGGTVEADVLMENIKDEDGHNRFIEGDIEIETKEGLTKDYGKWTLSGSHLLIVLAFTIQSGITIGVEKLGELKDLPQWIKDKIIPLFSRYVFANSLNGFTDSFGILQGGFSLYKQDSGEIEIRSYNSVTSTAITHFRVAFDLLIDNE